MKAFIATDWNFMRILRLVIGIAVIVFAIRNSDLLLGLGGGFLVIMSVFIAGCCGTGGFSTGGCNVEPKTKPRK